MPKLTLAHVLLLIEPNEPITSDSLVEQASLIKFNTTKGAATYRLAELCRLGFIKRAERGVYLISDEKYNELHDKVKPLKITNLIAQYVLKDCKDEELFEETLTQQKIQFSDGELKQILDQIKRESEIASRPTFDDVMRLI